MSIGVVVVDEEAAAAAAAASGNINQEARRFRASSTDVCSVSPRRRNRTPGAEDERRIRRGDRADAATEPCIPASAAAAAATAAAPVSHSSSIAAKMTPPTTSSFSSPISFSTLAPSTSTGAAIAIAGALAPVQSTKSSGPFAPPSSLLAVSSAAAAVATAGSRSSCTAIQEADDDDDNNNNNYGDYDDEDNRRAKRERRKNVREMRRATVREYARIALLCATLFLAGVSNWAVLSYVHDFVAGSPLPDVLFGLVPEQAWALRVGDLCVSSTVISLAVLGFVHANRMTLVRRSLFVLTVLYAMRSLTLFVTRLPPGYVNSLAKCRRREHNLSAAIFGARILEQTVNLGFQDPSRPMLCGDLLFSGHTLVMVTCALTVRHYLPKGWRALGLIPCALALVGAICMILSRTHYTIDVLIAYWMSTFVFSLYHAYAELPPSDRSRSVLRRMWLLKAADFFEKDCPTGRVENAFNLPFQHYLHDLVASARSPTHHKQISISSATTFA